LPFIKVAPKIRNVCKWQQRFDDAANYTHFYKQKSLDRYQRVLKLFLKALMPRKKIKQFHLRSSHYLTLYQKVFFEN